ncbi:MAG: hydroxymethylglutaryl-CoA reductase, degradative [Lactobacillus sp.]|nr:hydroxymethylglutaryl-CoA reductase, degradative [Lactobacillus sp.]
MVKFYELSRQARLAQLKAQGLLSAADYETLLANTPIPEQVATSMVENQLTEFSLPEGVVQDVAINGQLYQIPMVTEEPSVIAAANKAAGIVGRHGGFQVTVKRPGLIGQIIYTFTDDAPTNTAKIAATVAYLKTAAAKIASVAKEAYPSIVQRGGGLRQQKITAVNNEFVKLELLIDTKDAMGANMVNTICEAVAAALQPKLGQPLMAILSNYAPQDVTIATVALPLNALTQKNRSGLAVAQQITRAAKFAQLDVGRAVTHNKGIMNGINAVALAYDNDTRALAATIHSYAVTAGQYRALSTWTLDAANTTLTGRLAVPLPVGAVGGSIGIVPMAQANLHLGRVEDAKILQAQIAAIGLASNFAALLALVTDGIQKGHMHLQYKSLAIAAGATGAEIAWLQEKLSQSTQPNLKTAQALLKDKQKKRES